MGKIQVVELCQSILVIDVFLFYPARNIYNRERNLFKFTLVFETRTIVLWFTSYFWRGVYRLQINFDLLNFLTLIPHI